MRHISDAVQKMRQSTNDTRLIVTVEASLASTWLVPKLELFRLAHPGIDVLIDSSQHIVDMKTQRCGYRHPLWRSATRRSRHHAIIRRSCRSGMQSCILAQGPPKLTNLEQLRNLPLIHWDMSHMPWAKATRSWFEWDHWLQRVGINDVDTTKGIRFSDYGLCVQAATSNQGILLAGLPVLRETIDAGLLVCPFPDNTLTTDIEYNLVTTPEASNKSEVIAFKKWILASQINVSTIL